MKHLRQDLTLTSRKFRPKIHLQYQHKMLLFMEAAKSFDYKRSELITSANVMLIQVGKKVKWR